MTRKLWPILVLAVPVLALLACGSSEVVATESGAAVEVETQPVEEAAPAEAQEPESEPVEKAAEEQPVKEPQPGGVVAAEVAAINWYIDDVGYLSFVGVVRNTGTVSLEYVKPVVTLRDAQGAVVASEFTFTDLDVIEPGEMSPFILVFIDDVGGWTEYEVTVEAEEALYFEPYKDLEIISHNGRVDEYANYVVQGEVKNIGSEDAVFVGISAAFYDADNNIVATVYAFTTDHTVAAGGTSPFEIIAYEAAGEIDHYELYVEGQTE
jgi:hypothetical protein